MILVIGGAYQGKKDFAKRKFGFSEQDIHVCNKEIISFDSKCFYKLENFSYYCTKENIDPRDFFKEHEDEWKDCVFICEDIFCGVVPIDPVLREWRQKTGLLCQYLSGKADSVYRLYCGLEQRLK